MANIDKNPKQIAYLRHQTQTMLENLVEDSGGTTVLHLDPSNTDQGFISYNPPSDIGEEDDKFFFDSSNFSVQLPLIDDGTILVNSSGNLYNNIIRTYNQFDDGEFDIMVSVLAPKVLLAADIQYYLEKKYPCSGYYKDRGNNAYPMLYIVYENGNFKFLAADENVHIIGTSLPNVEINAIPLTNEI